MSYHELLRSTLLEQESMLMQAGRREEAAQKLQERLRQHPDSAEVRAVAARIFAEGERYDDALKLLRSSPELKSGLWRLVAISPEQIEECRACAERLRKTQEFPSIAEHNLPSVFTPKRSGVTKISIRDSTIILTDSAGEHKYPLANVTMELHLRRRALNWWHYIRHSFIYRTLVINAPDRKFTINLTQTWPSFMNQELLLEELRKRTKLTERNYGTLTSTAPANIIAFVLFAAVLALVLLHYLPFWAFWAVLLLILLASLVKKEVQFETLVEP
jgi:tetratricopeptide (TPR) repeat protein